jgi:hypothetical protein
MAVDNINFGGKIELLLTLIGLIQSREGNDSTWAWDWFTDPKSHWEGVNDRARIISDLVGDRNTLAQFMAIPQPPDYTIDALNDVIDPQYAQNTDNQALKKATLVDVEDSTVQRAFNTAVSLGISTRKVNDKQITIFAGGLRRRTLVFDDNDAERKNALQCDLELYVPFYALDEQGKVATVPVEDSVIQFGMAISHADTAIGTRSDGDLDMSGVRFNAAIPFTVGAESNLGQPVLRVQKQMPAATVEKSRGKNEPPPARPWQDFEKGEDWHTTVNSFLQSSYVQGKDSLLEAPLGPITAEKLTTSAKAMMSGRTGARQRKQMASAQFAAAMREWKKQTSPTPKLDKLKPQDEEDGEPRADKWQSTQTIGNWLESMGLISNISKPKRDELEPGYELTALEKLKEVDFWTVFGQVVDGLDGFPLFVLGFSERSKPPANNAASNNANSDQEEEKPEYTRRRLAAELATVQDENTLKSTDQRHFFGFRGRLYNIEAVKPKADAQPNERAVEVLVQLGKWMSNENGNSNWVRRLLPTLEVGSGPRQKPPTGEPGIGLYPASLQITEGKKDEKDGKPATAVGKFAQQWRADLVSLGLDINGVTDMGLFQTDPPRFRIGGVELRGMLSLEFPLDGGAPDWILAFGAKLNGIRLSLKSYPKPQNPADQPTPDPEPPATDSSDPEGELLGAMQQLFVEPPPPPKKKPQRLDMRLSTSKADEKANKLGFDLSVGYMSPLKSGTGWGSIDVQLYDSEGKRGGIIHIPLERDVEGLYLKSIGIGLRKVEVQQPELTLTVTGGLRVASFEAGIIDGGVVFRLDDPTNLYPILNGLDISFTAGPASISGGFLKRNTAVYDADGMPIMGEEGEVEMVTQYGGEIRIELEGFSIAAMGAYGQLTEGTNSLFIYGALTLGEGVGFGIPDILVISGLALGFGINRAVVTPGISEVAGFPLVRLVMGDGGYNREAGEGATRRQEMTSKAPEDMAPGEVLVQMLDALRAQKGEYFGAFGLRFTLFKYIDYFGLVIAQGGNALEIALIGLGRLKLPEAGSPFAYVELATLIDIKPDDNVIYVEAELTPNSWFFDPDCQLTGGFALVVWTGGENKGDFALSLGGYHPRFQRPANYPLVKRLGFNWPVNGNLQVKGGVYFAITPSSFMAGGRLEGTFNSGPVGASLLVYADFLIEWNPLYYEIDAGLQVKAWADLWLFTIHISLSVDMMFMGPPFHGIAHLKVGPISITVTFGDSPSKKPRISQWPKFGRAFLDSVGQDGKKTDETDVNATGKWQEPPTGTPFVPGPSILSLQLARGRITKPGGEDGDPTKKKQVQATKGQPDWLVRGDELNISVQTKLPASRVEVGQVQGDKTAVWPDTFPKIGQTAQDNNQPFTLPNVTREGKQNLPVLLDVQQTINGQNNLGIRPMGVTEPIETPLRLTVFRAVAQGSDEGVQVDLTQWRVTTAVASVPAAIWDTEALDKKVPDAKVIPDTITGLQSFRPPVGGPRGDKVGPLHKKDFGRFDLETKTPVSRDTTVQQVPTAATTKPAVATLLQQKAADRQSVTNALVGLGFEEIAKSTADTPTFRPLYATPLTN